MPDLHGLCEICGKVAARVCKLCGKHVCDAHYVKKTGLCTSCSSGRRI